MVNINESRPVFKGPAPWSETGSYSINATLQRGGRTFAVLNVGEKTKSNLPDSSLVPFATIHDIENIGESNGRWELIVNTNQKPEFYQNLMKNTTGTFKYSACPMFYSLLPLKVHYEVVQSVAAKQSGKGAHRRQERLVRGMKRVPAGRVIDIGYIINVNIEPNAHAISRRVKFMVVLEDGN